MLLFLAVFLVIYVWGFAHYSKHFLPKTTLNGIDVSGKTAEEAEALIAEEVANYSLTIEERDNVTETIKGSDISLAAEFNGEVEEILSKQSAFGWIIGAFKKSEIECDTVVSYDREAFSNALVALNAMNEDYITDPVNATVSEYVKGEGYSIVPEVYGNRLVSDKLYESVQNAIQTLSETVNLEEEDCYKNPTLYSTDDAIATLVENMNRYVNMTITYDLGDTTATIDGETIKDWLVVDGTDVSISTEAVSDYTVELASTYNTAFHSRYLNTSYGKEVEIVGGDYGWKVDKDAEYNQILADLEAGVDVVREMNFSQTANSHGENDYGDSYVEINLTAQHLYLYYQGECVIDTDFVSGNISKGNGTPTGAYGITYKERDATLNGENYSTPVSYWMPFCLNVGMHDASWRSSFGGSIYMTNGSHGCVNLPTSAAKTIFEYVDTNYPVLVYELAGTGPSTDGVLASNVIALIDAIGPVTLESENAINSALEAYNNLSDTAKALVTNYQVLVDDQAALAALKAGTAQ